MLIFKFICLFFGIFKSHSSFNEMLCCSSCFFKAPPPEYLVSCDWSAHARLIQHHLQQQSSGPELIV